MPGRRRQVEFRVTAGGCHECTSHARGTHGYPTLWKDGRPHNMHRVLFEEAHGALEDGIVVMHSCDNRSCINLAHLSPGTPGDNAADRNAKKRNNPPAGERAGNTSLTEIDVSAIRASQKTQREIGEQFGITQSQVSRIKSGKRWAGTKP